MKFTQATVAALALPPGKREAIYYDDEIGGFGLRLRAGGSARWIFEYKIVTKSRRMTLGPLAAIPPAQARKMAADLLVAVRAGRDPAAERAEGRARVAETFDMALKSYLPHQQRRLRPRSYVEVERHLTKLWRPLHGLPLAAIDLRAVAARLAVIAEQAGPVQANRARASLAAFFVWAVRQGLTDANPAAATGKQAERSRDRVLSPDELRAIWNATAAAADYSAVVRLLMLTGARLNEIAALRWSEVQPDRIVLPASRTKNARPHEIALTAPARAILDARPRRLDRDLIFGRRHDRPLSGWTELKFGLDKRIAAATGAPLPHWTHHDIRRTVASMMAELGIAPHVIEEVIGHVSGTSTVSRVYRRSGYEREARMALSLWSDHLSTLVEGGERVIIAFPQGPQA